MPNVHTTQQSLGIGICRPMVGKYCWIVHIESSMLVPTEFARLATVHGTVAAVSDPHEIANVLGLVGIRFMLANAAQTPFTIVFGARSQ
ncbi:MAG: hypothetical protein NHB32_14520 [Fischerella sp. CENA71]|nr:hypothetical protein [Fischerella sp. CENA71]